MQTLLLDIRYALRSLLKSPGFAAVAILTLGIGANTAIFTVVYGVLLRPLPFPQADRIVQLSEFYEGQSGEMDLTAKQLSRLQDLTQTFSHVAGYTDVGFNLATGSQAEHLRGRPVSADYFQVLGVRPERGRDFLPEEDRGAGERVAMISHGLWTRRFAADPGIIGRKILLNGEPFTLIGVVPASFDAGASELEPGSRFDAWIPLALVAKTVGSGENIGVIARLKPGIARAQLDAQMNAVTQEFRKGFPNDVPPKKTMNFLPYRDMIAADVRPYLLVLLGAIGFVLLIACANVASLLLARTGARTREVAVRMAIGASRIRLFRQLLTESTLLALASGALGIAVANATVGSLVAMAPVNVPRLNDVHLDAGTFAFAFLASLITGVILGIVPALHATKIDLNRALKQGMGRAAAGHARPRLRQSLVVGEFALSLVLLTGAGLMIATFAKLITTNPGFDPRRVVAMQFWLTGSKYNTTEQIAGFYRAVEQKLEALPGVEAAGVVAAGLPLERGGNIGVQIAGEKASAWVSANYREASPSYFRAMGIPLRRGHGILGSDTPSSNPVVVVNEAFANRYLAGPNPLGEHVIVNRQPCEVVGVVGDAKSFLDKPSAPAVFIPAAQAPYDTSRIFEGWFPRNIVVRATHDPVTLTHAIREAVETVDPLVPTGAIRSMSDMLVRSVALRRFMMLLLSAFGGLALTLASVGIYGIISYVVSQRTQEIGLRMALGARRSDVLRMVLAEGLKLIAGGTALGVASALALTRLLQGMLYGVGTKDPFVFALVSLLLAAVALLACYIPAWRATRVDPLVALRYE